MFFALIVPNVAFPVNIHVYQISMREDGFEFDKWLMTTDREFDRPGSDGPTAVAGASDLPQPFPLVPAPKPPATNRLPPSFRESHQTSE